MNIELAFDGVFMLPDLTVVVVVVVDVVSADGVGVCLVVSGFVVFTFGLFSGAAVTAAAAEEDDAIVV